MKKTTALLLILVTAPLLGGIYGILHDQLTYTISPEYYTRFKFYQFRLLEQGDEVPFPFPRLQVAIVGFMATWWMGVLIGTVLGLVGLKHKHPRQMLGVTLRAFLITMAVAFSTGLVGLLIGKFYLSKAGVNWWLPENLTDKASFIAVGSMHNFSYLGGAIGLIVAIIYSVRQRKLRS